MFRGTIWLVIVTVVLLHVGTDARKTSSGRSRGSSSRGTSSRRTNYNPQPAPTSFSKAAPAQSAGGTNLFGWQTKPKETPVQQTHTGVSHQSRASQQSHSYPGSPTGLSGNQQPPSYQQTVQQSHAYPQNSKPQQAHTYPQNNAQPAQGKPIQSHTYPAQNSNPNTQSHAYPASGGLSGHSGVGGNYPGQPGGSYAGASAPAYSGGQQGRPAGSAGYPVGSNNYHQGAPPPYSGQGYNTAGHGAPGYSAPGYGAPGYGGGAPGYGAPGYGSHGYGHGGYGGGYGSHGGYGGVGNFGGYNYGGMSRGSSTLSKVGIAGVGVGTLLTGLALWNLGRSGSRGNTYIYQDHRGNPIPVPVNSTAPATDPILGELVNCTLTISGADSREVIGIPCAIATSFSPSSDHKDFKKSENGQDAECTVTVVTKNSTEFSTTIPCSIFLNTAKEANVTEPPPLADNATAIQQPPAPPVPVGGPAYPDASPTHTGPPLDVPLAPYPVGSPYANENTSFSSYNPIGVPLATASPPCKPGEIADPSNPCVPATQDFGLVAPLGNSTPAAAA